MLTRASALFYWSAQHGMRAAVGGLPHFTRNSSAYGTGLDGSPVAAVVNTPRFEWVTLSDGTRRPALRLERAATNLAAYSTALAANWSTQAVTSVTGGVLDPLGGATAARVTNAGVNAGLFRGMPTPGADGRYAVSVSLRRQPSPAGSSGLGLYTSAWRGRVQQEFDANGKPVGLPAVVAGSTALVVPPTQEANGFLRLEMICDLVGGEAVTFYVWTEGTNNVASVVDVWAPQFETYLPTSRVLTPSSASVSRAAESCYWDFGHKFQPGVYYMRFVSRGVSLTGSTAAGHLLWVGGEPGGAIPFVQYYGYNGFLNGGSGDGAASHALSLGSPALGDEVEVVIVHHANGTGSMIRSLNRATSAVANSGTVVAFTYPSAARLYLNAAGTINVGQVDALEVKAVRYGDMDHTDVTSTAAADALLVEMREFLLSPTGEAL